LYLELAPEDGNPNHRDALTNRLLTIQQKNPSLFSPGAHDVWVLADVEMPMISLLRHLLFVLPKASGFLKIYPQIGFVSTI